MTQIVGEGVGVALEQSVTDSLKEPEAPPPKLLVEIAPPQTTSISQSEKAEEIVLPEQTIIKGNFQSVSFTFHTCIIHDE